MRSGGKLNPGMVSDFLLHVNVVGVVRFVFAVHTDYKVHAKAKRETRLQAKFHGRGNGYGDDASVMRFFELDMAQANMVFPLSIRQLASTLNRRRTRRQERRRNGSSAIGRTIIALNSYCATKKHS